MDQVENGSGVSHHGGWYSRPSLTILIKCWKEENTLSGVECVVVMMAYAVIHHLKHCKGEKLIFRNSVYGANKITPVKTDTYFAWLI